MTRVLREMRRLDYLSIEIYANILIYMWTKPGKFTPIRVQIIPYWYQILMDNKLDAGIDAKVLQDIFFWKIETNDIWRGEINFTVLENSYSGKQLIFNDDYKYFSSSVDFSTIAFSHFPKFWIKESTNGYNIGITLREEAAGVHHADKEIAITNLPYGLFRLPLFKHGIKNEEELKGLLEANNWEEQDIDPEGFFHGWDDGVKHKYVDVYWKNI